MINLAPGNLRKEGAGLDLPIAVSVLVATGQVPTASAEGVESPAVLDELQRLGCDFAQGFLVARPLTEKSFRDWWASHTAV